MTKRVYRATGNGRQKKPSPNGYHPRTDDDRRIDYQAETGTCSCLNPVNVARVVVEVETGEGGSFILKINGPGKTSSILTILQESKDFAVVDMEIVLRPTNPNGTLPVLKSTIARCKEVSSISG